MGGLGDRERARVGVCDGSFQCAALEHELIRRLECRSAHEVRAGRHGRVDDRAGLATSFVVTLTESDAVKLRIFVPLSFVFGVNEISAVWIAAGGSRAP